MSGLPRGWEQASIRSIASRIFDGPFGSNLKSSDYTSAGVRVIRLENIWQRRFIKDKWSFVSEDKFLQLVRHELRKNDILFSSFISDSIRICLLPSDAGISINKADVFCIRVDEGQIDAKYLMYRLSADDIFDVLSTDAVHGATRPRIGLRDLQSLEVDVPPTAEQRRIVAKIDSLSAKCGRARDHLDHIPQLVEKYKRAVLHRVYELARSISQEQSTLGQLAAEVRNGLSKKPSETPGGTPILRISAVRGLRVRLDERRFYPRGEIVPDEALLRDGDLLFTRYNGNSELTGLCGMVRGLVERLTYPDKLIRVRCEAHTLPAFVEVICAAPQSRAWLTPHIKSAAGQHGISGADLKRLPVPVPKKADQHEIVRYVETAFAWIDRLAAEAGSARALLDRLDQAILAKAFRGELVPQDPNDEPASVLLERIRAERAAAGPGPKRGRRPRAASGA